MGDNNLYGYPSFYWDDWYDPSDTRLNWNNVFISEDEQFDLWLRALSKRLSISDKHDADDWYAWLKIDPEYDYRAMYDDDPLSRRMAYDSHVLLLFPSQYSKSLHNGGLYYEPLLKYSVRNGRILNALDDVDFLLALDYLNENLPGYISYKTDPDAENEFNYFLNSKECTVGRKNLKDCYDVAIQHGLSQEQIAAIFANIYLESAFGHRSNSRVAKGIFLMQDIMYNAYKNWLMQNGLNDSARNLMEFVLGAMEGKNRGSAYINTPYTNLLNKEPDIVKLYKNNYNEYYAKYGNNNEYNLSLNNPMTSGITTEKAKEWFENGSLEDMTLAFSLLFERQRMLRDYPYKYGTYNRRMNLANLIYDYLKTAYSLDVDKKKRGGRLLPKRNVLPLI